MRAGGRRGGVVIGWGHGRAGDNLDKKMSYKNAYNASAHTHMHACTCTQTDKHTHTTTVKDYTSFLLPNL